MEKMRQTEQTSKGRTKYFKDLNRIWLMLSLSLLNLYFIIWFRFFLFLEIFFHHGTMKWTGVGVCILSQLWLAKFGLISSKKCNNISTVLLGAQLPMTVKNYQEISKFCTLCSSLMLLMMLGTVQVQPLLWLQGD